ncbi:MAG: hypothetical protein IPJ41_16200 [Phycisphaerales bacterium]|nr:hypothetical protein [Phycisphaerales bacterium]
MTQGNIDAIGFALAIVVAGAIGWASLRPLLDSEGNHRDTILQAAQAQQQLAEAQKQFESVRGSLDTAQRRLAANNVQLFAADRLTSRQEQLASVMRRGGLQLDQLAVGARTPGQLVDRVPFQLSGQGEFPQVVRQMHNLREAFPDMAVTSFQLSTAGPSSENKERTLVRFMLEIAWYTVRNDEAGGESSKPG